MRRRFTLAIVGVVAGALLAAGVGTIVLLTIHARRDARREVTDLAARIAAEVSTNGTPGSPGPALGPLQNFLKRTQQFTLVSVGAAGAVAGPLPPGVKASDFNTTALALGQTTSGFDGRTAFAVSPFTFRARHLAVVVTQQSTSPGGAALYFLIAGGAALVVAFGVAETLSGRIARPLVAVEQAAGRIAKGDFTARAPHSRRSYPELTSLTASVNAMADNLERMRGQERQFLMSVSHDLRTPLTSIRGFAEALADGTATDTTKAAGIIASEARRLERLVRDLLDLAKLDAHRFQFDLRPVDLWEVVSNTADAFVPQAERFGLTVTVNEPAGTGTAMVSADPDRLAQVVANLVENACNYATRTIVVSTWYGPSSAGLTVDDDGPGIPAEDLPHVFERAWTKRQGASRQVGSGLGLAIVAELVGAMAGTVHAEAGPGGGTRMVIRLRPASAPSSSLTS